MVKLTSFCKKNCKNGRHMGWCVIMLKSDMFETYDWAPYPIVLFQFLQYHSFLVFSSNAISLFHWHLNYNSFTREEDCIQNIFCTLSAFSNDWSFAVGGPYFIANLPNRFKIMNPSFMASDYVCKFLFIKVW